MPFILLLEDLIRGTSINKYFNTYKNFLHSTSDEIKEFQDKMLKKLVTHSYKNIPWYNSEMKRSGIIPNDIKSQNDIKLLPILSRDIIREHISELCWKGYKGKIFRSSSSGTTGIPITYSQDVCGYSAGVAAGHVLMTFSGWRFGQRYVYIWGNKESVKHWSTTSSRIKQLIYSRKNIASTRLNDPLKLPSVINEIIRHRPVIIEGYTNSIYELAEFIQTHSIKLPFVKRVVTTGENLEEHQRIMIENAIAPVSDLYGCGEINGIACRPAGDSNYYIFDPHVIVETFPESDSSMKEILVTDLNNYQMPFIRYKAGDMIDNIYPGSDNNLYPFSYFKNLYGRTTDHVVLPDGKKLFPINVFGGTTFRKFKSIKRHKTAWNGEKIFFIFETDSEIDLKALDTEIKKSLTDYNVDFEIQITSKLLPSENGKYRYFEVL